MSQYTVEPCLADINRCLMIQSLLLIAEIHEKCVVVPADKVSNNIVFVCKTRYINRLMKKLGISTKTGNPSFNLTAMSKDEILQNHDSVC